MMDNLEATQELYTSPKTQEELDALLESMGANRPTRTIGATLSPTLRDELGNPVPVDRNGEPIYFQANPDYNPDAKPSFENFKNNVSNMADQAVEGAKTFASDPLGTTQDAIVSAGENLYNSGKDMARRITSGNSTLGDVFDTLSFMIGAGPATSVATKGVRATASDLADTSYNRMFLTPGTKNLPDDVKFSLGEAQDMADQGLDPLTIKQQTGWENLAGKEWVYEIDDSQAHIKSSAKMDGITIPKEYTVPGGTISGTERQKLLLQAQRDIIELKKQLRAGSISQDEFDSLVRSRQDALDRELNYNAPDRTVVKDVPLEGMLKTRGTLEETFYHPELGNYVDMSTPKVDTDATKPKGVKKTVLGDFNPLNGNINIYKNAPLLSRRGTMIHEGQHFLDSSSGSPGTGFNKDRSPAIKKAAYERYTKAVQNFEANKLEDTIDYMNVYHFGPPLTTYEFRDLILESLYTDPKTFETNFSEDLLAEALAVRGNTNPKLTVQAIKENQPKTWNNITEFADILKGRDALISTMDDFAVYEAELGEVKARLADRRKDLTPEERRNSLATNDIRGSAGLPIDINRIFTTSDFE